MAIAFVWASLTLVQDASAAPIDEPHADAAHPRRVSARSSDGFTSPALLIDALTAWAPAFSTGARTPTDVCLLTGECRPVESSAPRVLFGRQGVQLDLSRPLVEALPALGENAEALERIAEDPVLRTIFVPSPSSAPWRDRDLGPRSSRDDDGDRDVRAAEEIGWDALMPSGGTLARMGVGPRVSMGSSSLIQGTWFAGFGYAHGGTDAGSGGFVAAIVRGLSDVFVGDVVGAEVILDAGADSNGVFTPAVGIRPVFEKTIGRFRIGTGLNVLVPEIGWIGRFAKAGTQHRAYARHVWSADWLAARWLSARFTLGLEYYEGAQFEMLATSSLGLVVLYPCGPG